MQQIDGCTCTLSKLCAKCKDCAHLQFIHCGIFLMPPHQLESTFFSHLNAEHDCDKTMCFCSLHYALSLTFPINISLDSNVTWAGVNVCKRRTERTKLFVRDIFSILIWSSSGSHHRFKIRNKGLCRGFLMAQRNICIIKWIYVREWQHQW